MNLFSAVRKKTALVFAASLIAVSSLYAQEQKKPVQSITLGGGFLLYPGMDSSDFSFFGMYCCNTGSCQFFGGLSFAPQTRDLTAGARWWPLQAEKIHLGIQGIYNLNSYSDVSLSSTILAGGNISYIPVDFFTLNSGINMMVRSRTIFATADVKPFLLNYTVALYLEGAFKLPHNFYLNVGATSYEPFRYPSFCIPSFYLECTYKLNSKYEFTLSGEARYADFFTLSANLTEVEIKLLGRMFF